MLTHYIHYCCNEIMKIRELEICQYNKSAINYVDVQDQNMATIMR